MNYQHPFEQYRIPWLELSLFSQRLANQAFCEIEEMLDYLGVEPGTDYRMPNSHFRNAKDVKKIKITLDGHCLICYCGEDNIEQILLPSSPDLEKLIHIHDDLLHYARNYDKKNRYKY